MSGLLLDPAALAARTGCVRGDDAPLAALAASLSADLDVVLRADVHVADRKARLTRAGGRCPVHGVELVFDPFSPHDHRCGPCGRAYAGAAHDEYWLYRYQLWLAERAVHAAALHAVVGRPELARFAARVLDEAAGAYLTLPNRDNVLGPTRPFFSTYLESLWLLSLCVALDLLESADGGAAHAALGARVRDQLVEPSSALIASFPEGRSNRQVWNATARLAASLLLGDAPGVGAALRGRDGVLTTLSEGLLDDGTWYEGENYHQFAHRGLWYAVAMADRAGEPIAAPLRRRFARGFAAPFRTAMPGATLPARRDSQYDVSLRQWRWAEWLELGLVEPTIAAASGSDEAPVLAAWLRDLYAADLPAAHGTGRWRASGEAERNEPARGLTRADLGWKSLLLAAAHPPEAPPAYADPRARSVLLDAQGVAILRGSTAPTYVLLDFGASGGGHGHPDRLNVQLPPFLVDPGTGSYVDRSLHWYRSTLAHAAPLVAERSQPATSGRLVGFDAPDDGPFAGASAEAEIADGVLARRTVIRADSYLIDQLTWRGLGGRTLDLPLAGEVARAARPLAGGGCDWNAALSWRADTRPGAGGLEDGFDFLTDVESAECEDDGVVLLVLPRGESRAHGGTSMQVRVHAPARSSIWRAIAPGAPGRERGPMFAVRAATDDGTIVCVWDYSGHMVASHVRADGHVELHLANGERHVHAPPPADGRDGWRIRRRRGEGQESEHRLALGARAARATREDPGLAQTSRSTSPAPIALADGAAPRHFALGERHYRRSEQSWTESGAPCATLRLGVRAGVLELRGDVSLGRPAAFAAARDENPLDNERPDVNSDGVQLHLALDAPGGPRALGAWLMVPAGHGGMRVTPTLAASDGQPVLEARWAPADRGWSFALRLDLRAVRADADPPSGAIPIVLDVLVNERPPDRERRRGQLVLGGAAGEFVYLRGDRHEPDRGVRLLVEVRRGALDSP